jgi:moderate conductance mechanosensitive channel
MHALEPTHMTLLAAVTDVLAQEEDAAQTQYQVAENTACSPTGDPGDASGNPICRAVYELTESTLLAENLNALLTASVRVIFIIVFALVLNRLLKRAIKRFVRSMNERGLEKLGAMARLGPLTNTAPINLQRASMRTETIGGVLHSLTTFVVFGIATLMVLGTFGFNLGPLIAGAGVAGIALGFGAQSLVKDFLSGIFMILEDQFGVGDIIDAGEARGTVEAISLRTTRIRDISGSLWHVPNGEIVRIANMSQMWSRALLDVGVAYETDIRHATRVMTEAAEAMAQEPEWIAFFFEPPEVWGVQALAADQITIRLVAKVTPAKQWAIERELRARLKTAFDEAGIEIPFPQRTVWVRQGELAHPEDEAPVEGGGPDDRGPDAGTEDADPPRGPRGSGGSGDLSPWFGTQSGTPGR